jgi:opacity protein-like surface antigen
MVSLFSSARATALSAMACALLSSAALAADMPFPFAPPPANDGPVEWGTGWYLRGDIGAAQSSLTSTDGVVLTQSFPNNWSAGLGGGYQYNNWFRTDVTVDYEQLYSKNGPQAVILPCQIGAVGWPFGTGPYAASFPVYAGCSPLVQTRAETMAVLANAYFDLGNWGGFTPYVGAGAGVNVLYQKSQMTWYEQNFTPYAGTTWTDPFTGGTYMANWDRGFSGTFLRFAYAFMGGVAYDVTDHIKIDLGYRWLNLGHFTSHDVYNVAHTKDVHVNQVRLGFRYMID